MSIGRQILADIYLYTMTLGNRGVICFLLTAAPVTMLGRDARSLHGIDEGADPKLDWEVRVAAETSISGCWTGRVWRTGKRRTMRRQLLTRRDVTVRTRKTHHIHTGPHVKRNGSISNTSGSSRQRVSMQRTWISFPVNTSH